MDSGEEQKRRLAQSLKILRRRKNWNQSELAEASDLSLEAIKRFETCLRWPKPKSLEALSRALGVTIDEVMGLHEKPAPSVQSLLQAMSELEKENQELRKFSEFVNLFKKASESDQEVIMKILMRGEVSRKSKKA